MDWYIIMAWGIIALILVYCIHRFRLLKYLLRFFVIYLVLIHPNQAQYDASPILEPISAPPPEQPLSFSDQLPRAAASLQDAIDELAGRARVVKFLAY
jgi:hypothetical protein